MKDLLNFDITTEEGDGVKFIHTIRHKKRPIALTFSTGTKVSNDHIPDLFKKVMRAWVYKYLKSIRRPLTEPQAKIYKMICEFYKQEGRPPSYDDIRSIMGYKSRGSAWVTAQRIIDRGWLWVDENGHLVPIELAAPDMTE